MADRASAPKDKIPMSDPKRIVPDNRQDEVVRRESSAQYKSSIEKLNRSHDRDIERALRHH